MWRALIGTLSIVVVCGVSMFGQPIPPGALSSSKPVFMGGKQVATTGAGGDLVLALDSTKTYALLHRDCSRYEIVQTPSPEEQSCQRDESRNQNGCRTCEVAGWITGGVWKPATATPATPTSDSAAIERVFEWYASLGANFGTATDHAEGVTRIRSELADLRYNSTAGESDDGSTGFFGSGGVVFGSGPIQLNTGVTYETYGEFINLASGERTNVAGTPSNLVFTSTTTTSLKIFGIDVGVLIPIGDRVFINPNVNFGWGTFDTTNAQQLQAGPPGPNRATTVVNSDTQSSSVNKFALGVHAEAGFWLNDWLGLMAGYSQRQFDDVYPNQPQVSRLTAAQAIRSFWVGLRAGPH